MFTNHRVGIIDIVTSRITILSTMMELLDFLLKNI